MLSRKIFYVELDIHWNKYNSCVTIKPVKRGYALMEYIKPIPIGVEFYKEITSGGYYYIDKTLLIRDLLANKNASIFAWGLV